MGKSILNKSERAAAREITELGKKLRTTKSPYEKFKVAGKVAKVSEKLAPKR